MPDADHRLRCTVVDERRFEPFGESIDAKMDQDPYSSLNKETEKETGWSYHGARWMAPQTARWLTPDPPVKAPDAKFLGEPWGVNPCSYVRQSPTVYWDPDGGRSALVGVEHAGGTLLVYGTPPGAAQRDPVAKEWKSFSLNEVNKKSFETALARAVGAPDAKWDTSVDQHGKLVDKIVGGYWQPAGGEKIPASQLNTIVRSGKSRPALLELKGCNHVEFAPGEGGSDAAPAGNECRRLQFQKNGHDP